MLRACSGSEGFTFFELLGGLLRCVVSLQSADRPRGHAIRRSYLEAINNSCDYLQIIFLGIDYFYNIGIFAIP
jgi:hypothetical protein